MIRVVLAIALATALLGVSLPVAERAERDRNAALAVEELEAVAARMEQLVEENDPVPPERTPAATTIHLGPPAPFLTDGGRFVVGDDRLVWQPATGRRHRVDPDVPIGVESRLRIARQTPLRLSFVRLGDDSVVRVERARVYNRSRGQRPPCSKPSCHPIRRVDASGRSTVTASASTATPVRETATSRTNPRVDRPW